MNNTLLELMVHRKFTSVFGLLQHLFGKMNHAKSVNYDFGFSRENKLKNYIHSKGLFY